MRKDALADGCYTSVGVCNDVAFYGTGAFSGGTQGPCIGHINRGNGLAVRSLSFQRRRLRSRSTIPARKLELKVALRRRSRRVWLNGKPPAPKETRRLSGAVR